MAKIFEIEHEGTIYEVEADDSTTLGQATVAFRQSVLGGSPGPSNEFSTDGKRSEFPGRAPGSPDPIAIGGIFDSNVPGPSLAPSADRLGAVPERRPYSPPSRRPADVRSGIAFVDELTNPNPEHVTGARMENRFFGGPIAGEAQRTIANDAIDQHRIPDYTSIGGEPIAPIAQPSARPTPIPTDNPLGRAVRAEMAKPDAPFVDRRDRIQWAAPEVPDTILAPMTPSSLAHGSAAVLTKAAQGIPAMAGDAIGLAADAADFVAPGAGRVTKTKVWSGVSKKWEDVDSLLSDTVEGIESYPLLKASRDAAAAHPDRGFFEKGFGYTSERGWHPTEADPSYLGEFGAEQAPNMALMYVTGVPGGVKAFGKTGKAISTFLGLAVPMSMEAQETREAVKRYELTTGESLDPTAKRAVTLGAGIIGGSMERLGFNSVMGRVASRLSPGALARFQKLVGVAGARVIESMATESVTEGGQGTTTNLAQSALGIKKIEEAFDGVPESMLLGAVMGLVMSSATSYASGDFDADARARADAAEVERVAGEALRDLKAKEAADGARKFASSAVIVNPGDAAPVQSVLPAEPSPAMPGVAGPGPTTPPASPVQPAPNESVEPAIPQQAQPPAESSMPPPPAAVVPGIPPEGPAVASGMPVNPTMPPSPAESIPQQPMPPMGQETQIPQQPVEPVPAMPMTPPVAPVAPVAPVPEPTVPQAVINDPHMIPAGTPMMATLPDGSTQQVTVQGMAADNVAMVIKADGTPTTIPTAALVNPDGSRLTETPVAPKPTGPKPGSSTATAAERMKSFKVGDIVAISDNVGSGMEIIEFKDLPNSKGVVVPHAVLRTVNGTTITRSSIVKANDAQVQHLTKTLAEREAAKNPPAPPVETPQKAPQIVQEAPPAPSTTTTAATPAVAPAEASTAPQTESATGAQIPETPAPATTKPARIQYKVGDLVEFGPVSDPTVGEIKSQDGDYFSIESEDGTVVQKADIKVRPARPVAEIASLRAAKEAAAEATTSPAAPGPAPVVVKKKGKKPKATNRPVRESRLNESAARPRTQIVGGETITLLTENSQGTEGPYTTLTFPDGSTTIIARLDSASTAGLPGWHVIDSSVEFSYIADTQKEAVAILATDKKRRGKGARVTSPSMVAPEGDISSIEENIPGNSPEENIPGNSPEINEKKSSITGEDKRKLEVIEARQKKSPAAPAASAPASSGAAPVAVAKVGPKAEPTVDPDTGIITNAHGVELLPGIIVSYARNDGSTDSGEIVGRGKNGGIRLNVMDVDTGAERSIIVDEDAITSKLMDSVPVVNSVFDDDTKPIQPEVVPEKKAKEPVPEKKAKPAEAPKKSLGKHIVQMLADIKSGKTNENIAKIMANLRGKKGRTLPQNVALRALDGARARTAVLMHPMLTGDPFLASGMAEAVAANDDAKLIAFLEKSAPTIAKIANTITNSTSMKDVEQPATKFFQSILNGPFASPKSIVAATYKPTATGVARRGLGGVVNSMALTLNKNLSRAGSGGAIGITTGRGGEIMFASLDDGFMLDIELGELSELMEAPTLVPADIERGVYALGEDNASDVRSIVADTAAVLNDYVDAYPTASVRVPGLKNQQTAFVSTDGTVNMADSGLAEYLMDRGADIKFSPSGDVVVATTGTGKARKIIGRFEVNVGPGATFTGFSLPTRAVTAVVREMVGEDTTNDSITQPAMLDKQDGGIYRTIPLPTSSTMKKGSSNWTPAEAAAYDIFAGKDLSAKVTADDVTKIVEAFQSIYGDIEIQPIYSAAHAELLYGRDNMVWEGIVDLAKSPGNGGLFSQADGRVFLFIENLNRDTVSPVRAVINTLVHEAIGHYGIQKFVNNAAAFVDDYWAVNKAAILADAKFNDGYSNYWERLPFFDGSTTMDAATYAKLFQPHLDKETIHSEDVRLTNRAIAEDHMLAQMEKILAERVAGRLKNPPKWYQELIAAIRNFINKALEGTTYADKLGIRTGGGVRFVDVESMLSSNSWRTARKSHMDVLRRVEELMASGSKGLDIEDFVEIHGSGNRSVDPKLFIRAVESNKLSEFARTLLAIPKSRTDIEVSDLWNYLFEKGVDMRTLDESGLLKQLDEGMKNPRATVKSIDHVISFIAKDPNGIHTLLSSHDVGKQRLSASTQKLLADFSERGMFVGKDAATADKSMLQKAKDRVAAGEDEKLVRRETGWQKGVDGLWRFEISDKEAKFKDKWAKLPAEMNDKEVMLREILDHPKLFAAYPELANVAVTKTDRDDGFAGWFSGNLNRITITSLGNDQLSTLLHEIQHWVQLREGFAGGGSPSDVLERLPRETLEKVKRDLVAKWTGLVTEGAADVERYELTLRLWAKHKDLVDASREADEEFNSYTGDLAEARDMLSAASSAADKALREALKQGEGNADNAPWKDVEHILGNPSMTRAGIVRKLDSRKAALLARKRRLAGIVAGDIKFIKQSLIENNGLFELYRRIAGEIEARATEKRMGLDEAERAARDVEDDESPKRSKAIILPPRNTYKDGPVQPSGAMELTKRETPMPEPPPEVAEQHRRLEETNGIEDDATFTGKVIEHFTDLKQNMTQAFPRLFTTKRPVDAVVNDQLRQLNEATNYASAVTGNVLRDITAGLTKAQEKQMGYILAIRDVVNQIKVDGEKGALESHGALQFGIKSLDHALEVLRFEESMADDAIRGAIAKRQAFMKQFVQQLKEYGLLPENHKDAETYFRRQTLYYYDMSDSAARAWGAKRKLRPASFGGFKQRTGSGMQSINAETNDFRRRVHEFDVRVAAGWNPTPAESLQNARLRKEISNRERDFNTNYRQSEFEHIAAGYHTMRSMDVLKSMRALIDEGPILRMEAREINLLRAYGGAENMTRVNDLLEESRAIGKGKDAKERARKKEITQELDQIDPLAPARKMMGQGIGMLGSSLKKNGIPNGLPPEHHFIAEELVRKAMTKDELEEANESGMFDASSHGYTEMEEGSLFGLMKWLDANHPNKFGGIGLVYKAISERQHAIKKAVEDSGETYETAATLAEATRSAPITGDEFEAKGHKATHNRAGLVKFSPDDKHLMFHVMTVGDRMLKVMLDKMETDGIDGVDKTAMAAMLKAAKPALAFGPLAEEWYVPENVAKQLNEYGTNKGGGKFNAFHSAVAAWKSWKLQGPMSAVKYNVNNSFGDADAVLAAYPGAFKLVPQVLRDLREYYGIMKLKKNFKITPGIRDIENRIMSGVASGGINASELADLDNEIMLANKEWNPKNPLSVTGQAIGKYFATASKYSNARENVLRIAVHRYLENLASTNEVLPRGASSGAELDMMAEGYRIAADRLDRLGKHNAAKELLEEGKKAQIAKVARELLGDYGNISAAGQVLRRGPIPFVSWLEINAPRYARLLRNAYADPTLTPGSKATKIARAGGAAVAAGAVRVGSTIVKMHFLMAAVSLFNHYFFGDEEKEFGSSRNQMHLMLGHNADGSLKTLRAQGALSDVYGWVGLETPLDDFRRLRAGEVTKLGLFLYEPVKAVINKVVNGIDPFSKGLFEGLSGSKFYPSVFKDGEGFERDRRYSRDGITEGILNSIVGAPMPDIFRALNDTPSRKKSTLDYFLTYRTDPREQAFWDTKDIVQAWIEKTGKGNPAGSAAPLSKETSQALYKYRKAVQYGWPELADHWASEFLKAGGKPMALTTSIRKSGPLDGIPLYNRLEFYKSLNPDQKRSVDIAREWYDEQAKQLESNMKDRPEYPEGLRNEYRERKLLAAQPKYPKGIDKASTFIPGTSGMMKSQYLENQGKR